MENLPDQQGSTARAAWLDRAILCIFVLLPAVKGTMIASTPDHALLLARRFPTLRLDRRQSPVPRHEQNKNKNNKVDKGGTYVGLCSDENGTNRHLLGQEEKIEARMVTKKTESPRLALGWRPKNHETF
jgi:hypothetical protein